LEENMSLLEAIVILTVMGICLALNQMEIRR
jgi:hypothetical protein